MQILPECIGSAVVINLFGRLTVGTDFSPLCRLCGQLNRSPGSTIVVDLSGVERVDCAGVGELIRLHECAESAGGEMRIVNPGRLHRQMLEIFHLIEPLNVCSTMRAALRGWDTGTGEARAWHLPAAIADSAMGSNDHSVLHRGGKIQ